MKKVSKKKEDTNDDRVEKALRRHSDEVKHHMEALIEATRHDIAAVAEQYLGLNSKVDAQKEMIGRIMVDTQEIKDGFRRKANYDDFAKLEKRVVVLEAMFRGAKSK